MDEQSKAQLDAILAKEPAALTDSEKEFLRARRSYLTVSQREVFAEVLAEQEAEQTTPDEANPTVEPTEPKKTKKATKASE